VARPIILDALGLNGNRPLSVLIRMLRERYEPALIQSILASLRAATETDPRTLAQTHPLHLSWRQIEAMAAAGMTFGNHTCSHPPLANLPLETCREEIRQAATRLSHLPGGDATLAYPFGSRTEETRRVALELGYRGLLEVEGINRPLDPARIGRIKVEAISPAVLFARMEIVEPVKSMLKRWLRRRPR
ncbi:MAG: polysaccharide deacetylase family protein, partial [Isosphaeraceae bacterium]